MESAAKAIPSSTSTATSTGGGGEGLLRFGSSLVHFPPTAPQSTGEATTNVVLVALADLAKENNITTGDPVLCSSCKAALNVHSKIQAEGGIWQCEFCGHQNQEVNLDDEERPSSALQDFVLEHPPERKQEETNPEDDSLVLFVIDTSGSMCVSEPVKGWKRRTSPHGAPPESASQYVTRLEFVQAAVIAQLQEIKTKTPKRKIGIIGFGTNVTVFGAGGKQHVLSGELDYPTLMERGAEFRSAVSQPISENYDDVCATVDRLNESGGTALGPALVTAVAIAANSPTSKIVICTDGVANVGIGSLDTGEQAAGFYEEIGEYAKNKGLVISVLSIKGTQTKLEYVGSLADRTRGSVDLVDPTNLDFSAFLSKSVVATNCVITLHAQSALAFRLVSEEQGKLTLPHVATRDVGNVFEDTQVAYEFDPAPGADFKSLPDAANGRKSLLFQLHADFTKANGMRCKRVLTIQREATTNKQEAERSLDIRVVSANLAQQSGAMARNGNYEAALANATSNKLMIEKKQRSGEEEGLFDLFMREYAVINETLQSAIQREQASSMEVSAVGRRNARDDLTAAKLYNYKSSSANACLLQ